MANFDLENYVVTQTRIVLFWERFPNGAIRTNLMSDPTDFTICRYVAKVYKDHTDAEPVATGWAFEIAGKGMANQTSHEENCETSAIGRALANLGFATKQEDRPSREEMGKVNRGNGPAPEPKPAPPPKPEQAKPQAKARVTNITGEDANMDHAKEHSELHSQLHAIACTERKLDHNALRRVCQHFYPRIMNEKGEMIAFISMTQMTNEMYKRMISRFEIHYDMDGNNISELPDELLAQVMRDWVAELGKATTVAKVKEIAHAMADCGIKEATHPELVAVSKAKFERLKNKSDQAAA